MSRLTAIVVEWARDFGYDDIICAVHFLEKRISVLHCSSPFVASE